MKATINNPCNENWDKMSVGIKSRHCLNCKKDVIDFTSFSREELVLYLLQNRNNKTCGRIYKSQLDFQKEELLITIEGLLQKNRSPQLQGLLLSLVASMLLSCSTEKPVDNSIAKKPKADTALQVIPSGQSEDQAIPLPPICDLRPYEEIIMGEMMVIGPENIISEGPVFDINIEHPLFVGGNDSLSFFIKSNLVYPEYEKKKRIEGTVIAEFVIDSDGKILVPEIVKSVKGAKNFDKEVLRVINLMPPWIPGKSDSTIVPMTYTLPIRFSLKE